MEKECEKRKSREGVRVEKGVREERERERVEKERVEKECK